MSFAFLMISCGASSRVMNTASSPSSRPRRRNCVANVVFPAPGEPITTVVVWSLIPPSMSALSPYTPLLIFCIASPLIRDAAYYGFGGSVPSPRSRRHFGGDVDVRDGRLRGVRDVVLRLRWHVGHVARGHGFGGRADEHGRLPVEDEKELLFGGRHVLPDALPRREAD